MKVTKSKDDNLVIVNVGEDGDQVCHEDDGEGESGCEIGGEMIDFKQFGGLASKLKNRKKQKLLNRNLSIIRLAKAKLRQVQCKILFPL